MLEDSVDNANNNESYDQQFPTAQAQAVEHAKPAPPAR
jgi:hypothetical protein